MAYRVKGEGNYSFDSTRNRWVFRITYKNKIYRLYGSTGDSKKALQPRVNELLLRLSEDKLPYSAKLKFSEWIERWLALEKPTVKIRTYDYYFKFCKNYILPELGHYKVKDLTALILQEFLNRRVEMKGAKGKVLSVSSVNGIRRVLIRILNVAKESNIISSNPAKSTKRLKDEDKDIVALSAEQLKKLIEVAGTQEYIYVNAKQRWEEDDGMAYLRWCTYYLIIIAIATGMRQGEIFGLSWKNVDFKDSTITVKQNLQYTSEGLKLDSPKTSGSKRKLKVDTKTIGKLKEWKRYQEEYSGKYFDLFDNKNNLVFTNSFGKPLSASNFRRTYWRKLMEVCNFDNDVTFHSLRHSHATNLLAVGVDVKTVSRRLGHASLKTTMIYLDLLPAWEEKIVDKFSELDLF